MSRLTAVILAAGLGTRMKSALPKVLHPIAGRPLLHYAVRAAFESPQRAVGFPGGFELARVRLAGAEVHMEPRHYGGIDIQETGIGAVAPVNFRRLPAPELYSI